MAIVEVIVSPSGDTTITTTDLLEDFWFDFLNFQRDVKVATRASSPHKVRRYLRAALFSFVNYISGLIDRWSAEAGISTVSSDGFGSGSTIVDRIGRLLEGELPSELPSEELRFLESLARRCANLQPSDEAQLIKDLAVESVEPAEMRILAWIRDYSRRMGKVLHVDTRAASLSLADQLGEVLQESYQGFEVLGDDYQSLQDELDGWGPADEPGLKGADD